MELQHRNPLLAPAAMFLIALSLSIGWGIRGNFGHEAGAMIAGVLSAIAVAVLSGRDDWRNRVAYFALFGGLGWGFGGSIAYMYPISFTESGHTAHDLLRLLRPVSGRRFVVRHGRGGHGAGRDDAAEPA